MTDTDMLITEEEIRAAHPTNQIALLRAAGKLTLADEERLVRLYHDTMSRGDARTRKIMAEAAAEQIEHYERAKAKAG